MKNIKENSLLFKENGKPKNKNKEHLILIEFFQYLRSLTGPVEKPNKVSQYEDKLFDLCLANSLIAVMEKHFPMDYSTQTAMEINDKILQQYKALCKIIDTLIKLEYVNTHSLTNVLNIYSTYTLHHYHDVYLSMITDIYIKYSDYLINSESIINKRNGSEQLMCCGISEICNVFNENNISKPDIIAINAYYLNQTKGDKKYIQQFKEVNYSLTNSIINDFISFTYLYLKYRNKYIKSKTTGKLNGKTIMVKGRNGNNSVKVSELMIDCNNLFSILKLVLTLNRIYFVDDHLIHDFHAALYRLRNKIISDEIGYKDHQYLSILFMAFEKTLDVYLGIKEKVLKKTRDEKNPIENDLDLIIHGISTCECQWF